MKYREPLSAATKYTIVVAFAVYSAYNLVLTALQDYILFLSGEAGTLGTAFGIFTLSAVLSRFLSGLIIEKIDDAAALVIGNVVLTLTLGWYSLASNIATVYVIRAVQGFGWALSTVTILTMISENTESVRMSAALGYLNVFGSLSLMFFPVIGSWIITIQSLENFIFCFQIGFGIGIISTLLSICVWRSIPPVLEHEVPISGMPERAVLTPTISIALLFIPHGLLLSYSPEVAVLHGIDNPGLFFTAFAFAQIIGSVFGGVWTGNSQYRGVASIGAVFVVGGITTLVILTDIIGYIIAAALIGFGLASANIALNSFVSSVSTKSEAKGMAIYSAGVDSAIALGSFAAALLLGLGMGIPSILSLFTIAALASAVHSLLTIE